MVDASPLLHAGGAPFNHLRMPGKLAPLVIPARKPEQEALPAKQEPPPPTAYPHDAGWARHLAGKVRAGREQGIVRPPAPALCPANTGEPACVGQQRPHCAIGIQFCLHVIVKPAAALQPGTCRVVAVSKCSCTALPWCGGPLRGRFATVHKHMATWHRVIMTHLWCRIPHCLALLLQSLPPQPYAPLAAPLSAPL